MTEPSSKIYFPNLDGLRFWAFLGVFFAHSKGLFGLPFPNGTIAYKICNAVITETRWGVSFFFVLSGFLITYLLLTEQEKKDRINIVHFYARRVLRIFPLYYLALVVGFALPFIVSYPEFKTIDDSLLHYATFTANFQFIYPFEPSRFSSTLIILWSISIEEQFYLVFPLILYFLQPRYYGIAFSIILLFSFLFKCTHPTYNFQYYHTFSAYTELSIGCISAFLCKKNPIFLQKWIDLPRVWIMTLYISLGLFPFVVPRLFGDLFLTNPFGSIAILIDMVYKILFACVILEQNFAKHSIFKISQLGWFTEGGKISYGLYVWHTLAIFLTWHWLSPNITHSWCGILYVLSFSMSWCIAKLSFIYFESYFLHLAVKFKT